MNFKYEPFNKIPDRDPLHDGQPVTARQIIDNDPHPDLDSKKIRFEKLPVINEYLVKEGIKKCYMSAFTTAVTKIEKISDTNHRDYGRTFSFEVMTENESENLKETLGSKPYYIAVVPHQNTYRIISQTTKFIIGEYDLAICRFIYYPELNKGNYDDSGK